MVRWYHAIFSAYGFWLPNDPRGSWSDFVHAYELYKFGGPATKVNDKRSYAHDPHDTAFRREAKERLKYPPVRFERDARDSIARGFRDACDEYGFAIHACAIGFDHVHIVTSRDAERSIEGVVSVLKSKATRRMNLEQTHPMAPFSRGGASPPTAWADGRWSVFINDETQLAIAIAYVERHPVKEGIARQAWTFVTPLAR